MLFSLEDTILHLSTFIVDYDQTSGERRDIGEEGGACEKDKENANSVV